MHARRCLTHACLAGVATMAATPHIASAQLRRQGGGGGAPPPVATPMRARAPFAGVWEGMREFKDGPEPGMTVPTTMVFDADSSGTTWTGYAVLPNGRGPYDQIVRARESLTFQHPNSGGGVWKYRATLVGQDTLRGTFELRDWPQGNGEKPSGTFTLVRRRPS